jgi:hypothetical protein
MLSIGSPEADASLVTFEVFIDRRLRRLYVRAGYRGQATNKEKAVALASL